MTFWDNTLFDTKLWAQRESEKNIEHSRLALKHAAKPLVLNKGDKVVAAIGMFGHGFAYARGVCEVLQVGDESVELRYGDSSCGPFDHWVKRCFVTDVLPAAEEVKP